jgi:hypothetical protein
VALKDESHCDFEDPTTNLCRVLCGGSSAQMQARIRDETVRAAIELLGIAATRDLPAAPADSEATSPPEACTESCGDADPPATPGPSSD